MFQFYFSFIFLMMVYSTEQNTFIVVSYVRNGKFINCECIYSLSDYKNKFRAKYPDNIQGGSLLIHIGRIVNRFLTTGTVSKGKSSGRQPKCNEIVERKGGRDSTNIRSLFISTIWCTICVVYVVK
jgi:hypothetical protein